MNHNTGMRAGKKRARRTFTIATMCFSAFIILLAMSSPQGMFSQSGATTGDRQRGKELFEKRCGGCHSLDKDKEGPRLGNVFGRKAGTTPSFKYSDSLKSAQVVWNEASLDKWLIDTDAVVPDNDMDFHVPKADERADIIQFLRVSSGNR
jgi:cytochrome c